MTLNVPPEALVLRATHKSLGFNVLLDMMRGDRTYSVLDLGPALKENVRFWSQFRCRLYLHDFYRSYRERKAGIVPVAESEEAVFSALLQFDEGTVFDIILAWDLFNYFGLRELEALVQRLGRWCRQGTRVFAMISSHPKIPASPTIFRILNREQISYEIPTRETRPNPRYQPRDIDKLMARFTVIKSFLLHNGIREYVFALK